MDQFPEIERQPLSVQAAFQYRKLQSLLAYLGDRSPYYRRRFRELSVDPAGIRSLTDLQKLPVTEKADLQDCHSEFLCVPKEHIREYVCTSGTLGQPVRIALTQRDLNRLAYNEYLSFQSIGIVPGDVVQLMLTLDRQFIAGMAYYSGLQRLGAAAVRFGPGLPTAQWETLSELRVTGLVAVPSFLLKMLQERPDAVDPEQLALRRALMIGENLRTDELKPNTLASQITRQWPITLFGTYATTEIQTAFTECSAQQGGHHRPELVIVELLDEDNHPVSDGIAGEITITTLGVEGMPLLRYKTGDMAVAHRAPCSCGRQTLRLGPIIGRKQQLIKYKGTTVYPPAIIELLQGIAGITNFQINVSKDNYGNDELCLLISSDNPDRAALAVRKACRHKLRVVPRLSFISDRELSDLLFPAGSRKAIRFRDER